MRIYVVILCLLFLHPSTHAQKGQIADSVVVIGIKPSPPFVKIFNDRDPEGLSIAFWQEVENSANISFEYKVYEDLPSLLNALKAGEVDMSINPITVTEHRMYELYFSQPFFISGTTMVRKKESNWLGVLKNIFSWRFFSALAVLLLVIWVFGFLIWTFERRKNHKMFHKGWRGIGDGFWWSAVTMTTVGYGDKAPVTRGGRFIGFIWMFVAILLISGLTASIASALTVSNLSKQINSPEDLHKFEVGTVEASSSAQYLDIFNLNYSNYTNVEEGLRAIDDGEIQVFVYDRPILKHFLLKGDYKNMTIGRRDFKTDYYSFSYPIGSPLRDALDPHIVKALKSENWSLRLRQNQ